MLVAAVVAGAAPALLVTAGAAATAELEAWQRTKKLPSVPLNTG